MLPPVDPRVFKQNPEFAKLYTNLIKYHLNPDGSTRNLQQAEKLQEERQSLDQHLLGVIKNSLIKQAVSAVSYNKIATAPKSDLLEDMIFLLPSLLDENATLSSEDISLIVSEPPFSEREALLPQVASLVSANLYSSALSLARIAHPDVDSAQLYQYVPLLPDDVLALRAELSEVEETFAAKQMEAITALVTLLQEYTSTLTSLIHTIEAKHGPAARRINHKAKDVAVQAQRMEAESEAAHSSISIDLYPDEAVAALNNYLAHLKDAKMRAKERVRNLEAELMEYGTRTETLEDVTQGVAGLKVKE